MHNMHTHTHTMQESERVQNRASNEGGKHENHFVLYNLQNELRFFHHRQCMSRVRVLIFLSFVVSMNSMFEKWPENYDFFLLLFFKLSLFLYRSLSFSIVRHRSLIDSNRWKRIMNRKEIAIPKERERRSEWEAAHIDEISWLTC